MHCQNFHNMCCLSSAAFTPVVSFLTSVDFTWVVVDVDVDAVHVHSIMCLCACARVFVLMCAHVCIRFVRACVHARRVCVFACPSVCVSVYVRAFACAGVCVRMHGGPQQKPHVYLVCHMARRGSRGASRGAPLTARKGLPLESKFFRFKH